MKPREMVLEQIHHRETHPVPYSLGFEGDVAEQLDALLPAGKVPPGDTAAAASAMLSVYGIRLSPRPCSRMTSPRGIFLIEAHIVEAVHRHRGRQRRLAGRAAVAGAEVRSPAPRHAPWRYRARR